MKLLSSFIIFSLTFKLVISNCPVVTCDSSTKYLSNTSCAFNDETANTISLSKCLDYQSCFLNYPIYLLANFSNSQISTNLTCINFPLILNNGEYSNSAGDAVLNVIGVETDYCTSNLNCGSNLCNSNSNLCVGTDNKPCSDTYMCSVNSYCDKIAKKCKARVQNGINCSSDDYCINTSGCLNGRCATLNFLVAGKSLNNTNSSDARFCISNWTNSQNVCEDLINVGDAPYFCDGLNAKCNYTSSITNTNVTMKNCNCDIITGSAICPLGTNTDQYINYVDAYLNTLWYPCHYYNKGSCYLITQLSRYYFLNTSFLWSGFTPLNSALTPCLAPTNYPVFDASCLLQATSTTTPCVKKLTNDGSRIYFKGLLSLIAILLILT